MLDGTYEIVAKTPMGDKSGTLTLQSSGEALSAHISVPGLGKYDADGTANDDRFAFSGQMKIFLMGKVSYDITGSVDGDALKATCKTSKGSLNITGTRVS